MQAVSPYLVCAKCKARRQIYITDQEPSTLSRYKTCDLCRHKNKMYKKKQRLHLQMRQAVVQDGDPVPGLTPEADPPDEHYSSLDKFLYPLSQNDVQDVPRARLTLEVPSFIIPRLDSASQRLTTGYIMSTAANQQRIRDYHEQVKALLKVHYLNRIHDILKHAGYGFKTRSTNWKNGKFYSQMLCSAEAGSRKDMRSSRLIQYRCDSHLNYSFDTYNGQFHVDYGHLCHRNLAADQPQWADYSEVEESVDSMESVNPPSDYLRRTLETVVGTDESPKQMTAFASALNNLHQDISSSTAY